MYRDQFLLPGFGRSLLSLMRSGTLGDQRDCYRALGRLSTPVLLLRGSEDVIVRADQVATTAALVPHAILPKSRTRPTP